MSKIEGYSAYQTDYYKNNVRKEKEADKAAEAKKAKQKDNIQLSDKAKRLLEELKQKYGNMDFIIANYDTDAEAASYLARGTKEYSVLIEPETLEAMAADESIKEKYLGIIDEATGKLDELKKSFSGEEEDTVVRLGITIADDGTVSYFADLEKMSEKQRERIAEAKEEKKEKEAKAEKAEEDKKYRDLPGKTQRTRVTADSIEDLLKKIREVDWSKVKVENQKSRGGRVDFTV